MVPEVVVELDYRNERYLSVEKGLLAVTSDLGGSVEAIGPIVRGLLKEYMTGVVLSVRKRMQTPYPGGTSPAGAFPGTLSKRSGKLQSEMVPARIEVKGSRALDSEVSFTLPGIAAVHERGAVIRPVRAQYLTVPLPAALDSRGVPRKPRARDWPNTFIFRSKKGNLLIAQSNGAGGITPLYVLKKSVTIPKRLAFQEAFEAGRDFLADKIADEVIREFFQGGSRVNRGGR